MKFSPQLLLVVFTAITGVAMAIATPAQAADDQETIIKRNGSYSTSNGGSGTTSSVTTRSNGNVQRNGTWTNAAGGTGRFQSQRTHSRATRSAIVSGSVTRPNGKTSTYQGTAVRTAPGVVSSNGTITQANGKQDTLTATDTRLAPGTWLKQETITTADGKTIDRSVQTSVANAQGTRTVTSSLPDGRKVTQSAQFSQSPTTTPAPPSN
ncbi:MAG TPA: hypothetical protein VGF85_02315 [Opitutaceae bacterium]|jgi:hypothetical protein